MVWGKFDGFIVAILPAKDLRARVRAKGAVAASDEYKALVLRRAIPELLQDHALLRDPTTRRIEGAGHKRATLHPDPHPSRIKSMSPTGPAPLPDYLPRRRAPHVLRADPISR